MNLKQYFKFPNNSKRKDNFLDLVKLGKTDLKSFRLGILVILIIWTFGTFLVTLPLLFVIQTNLLFLIIIYASFIPLIIGIWLSVHYIHKRPFISLLTPAKKINLKQIFSGFSVFILMIIIITVLEYIIRPSELHYSFNLYNFLIFLPFMIFLTPIQTTAEELLFRGYLLQATGILTKNLLILCSINGFLFFIPHLLNPELSSGFVIISIYYVVAGAFFAFITLKSGTLELALGAHYANNISAIISNNVNSSLPTASIFTSKLDPIAGLVEFVFIAVFFYLIIFKLTKLGKK
jgi:CAAX protease family protein